MSHFNSSISPHSARAWHSLCPRPSHVIWTRALAGRERRQPWGKSSKARLGARTKAAFMTADGLFRSTPRQRGGDGRPRAERVISGMICASCAKHLCMLLMGTAVSPARGNKAEKKKKPGLLFARCAAAADGPRVCADYPRAACVLITPVPRGSVACSMSLGRACEEGEEEEEASARVSDMGACCMMLGSGGLASLFRWQSGPACCHTGSRAEFPGSLSFEEKKEREKGDTRRLGARVGKRACSRNIGPSAFPHTSARGPNRPHMGSGTLRDLL